MDRKPTWADLVPVILQYGLPLAEKIWLKWSSGKEPTQADWDELRSLAQSTPRSQILAAASRAGIAETDANLQAILALLPTGA